MRARSIARLLSWPARLAAGALSAFAGGTEGEPAPAVTARLTVERAAVFVQEEFEAIIEVRFRGGEIEPRVRLEGVEEPGIEWAGFHELRAESVQQNGRRYEVRRFRSRGRAVAPGNVRFHPRLHVQWRPFAPAGDGREGWDFFYGRRPPFSRLEVRTEPVTVQVRPLPEAGRPESFSGAVGRFVFDLELDRTETRVGEPVSIRALIEGEGNIEQARPPVLDPGADFRAYQPRLIAYDYDPVRGRGRKVYEFVLLPRTAGSVEIPSVSFSFFDPRAETYHMRVHGPLSLYVEPGVAIPDLPEDPENGWLLSAPHSARPTLITGPVRWRRSSPDDARWRDRALVAGWVGLPALAGLLLGGVGRWRARRVRGPEATDS